MILNTEGTTEDVVEQETVRASVTVEKRSGFVGGGGPCVNGTTGSNVKIGPTIVCAARWSHGCGFSLGFEPEVAG